jgi:uncharacterized membrane protein YgcG
MDRLWILPFALLILLDIAALYLVIEEDLLYTPSQKFRKTLFILLIPFIGAVVELYKIGRYLRMKNGDSGPDDGVKWYVFWRFYTGDHASSGGDGSGDGGGGSSGGE